MDKNTTKTLKIVLKIIIVSLIFQFVLWQNYIVSNIITELMRADKNQVKTSEKIQEENFELAKWVGRLQKELKQYEMRDVPNIETLKAANVLIKNYTLGGVGSGTVIKLDGEFYILTAAHVAGGYDNVLEIQFGELNWPRGGYPAVVKYIDTSKDLALLEVYKKDITSYAEISEIAPVEGSKLIVIGCPNGNEDIVTDGILSKVNGRHGSVFTNKIYFGNSGGGVFYNGKLCGVAVSCTSLYGKGISVSYGHSPTYNDVINFLNVAKRRKK